MRTSRSKKSDLNALAIPDEDQQGIEGSVRTYGGFGSLFSRARKSKAVEPVNIPSHSEVDDVFTEKLDLPKKAPRSLDRAHHRLFSRSMSDLSALIKKDDFAKSQHATTSPESNRTTSAESLGPYRQQESPSRRLKGSSRKSDEQMPFPAASISKHGWLNRRTSRRETNLQIQRVYVCPFKIALTQSSENPSSICTSPLEM